MILLDTCTLLWLAKGEHLPPAVAARIGGDEALFVSAFSALEIGVKVAKGRLELPVPLGEWWPAVLEHFGTAEVPVDGEIAVRATALPPIHNDPADPFILASALHLRATLLTPDPAISAYPDAPVAWG